MRRNRFLTTLLILLGFGALFYILVSLFVPSPRRLIFGVDKRSGKIRMAESRIAFLPPHQYYRLNFEIRGGSAAHEGVVVVRSSEGLPVKLTYHLRFGISDRQMPDAKRLVREGWSAWIRARVAEAVSALSTKIPVEELVSPSSRFAAQRSVVRNTVARHLAESGLAVTSFEIERIEVEPEEMLRYKRVQLRRNARGPLGRVAVIGLDGADWELIRELIYDGRMPNLAAMIEAGTTGIVQSVQPPLAPLAWTSLATGLPPDRHGVLDFLQREGAVVTSSSRKAPALFDIAPAFGRSTAVVNWWAAWPPTHPDVVVFDTPVDLAPAAIYPSRLGSVVTPVMIPEDTVDFRQISRFVNLTESEFRSSATAGNPRDPVLAMRAILAKTWSDHRAAIALFKRLNPMLTMVLYDGTDDVNHLFGPYHPPRRGSIPFEEYRKYWPTVANYYSEIDRLIGEWIKVLPADTTLMVVSPYGMTWGSSRPAKPPAGSSALAEHRRSGIFVAAGNRVVPSKLRRPLTVYDITPTVLSILGLPQSSEMSGAAPEWLLDGVEPIRTVPMLSYSEVVRPRPVVAGDPPDRGAYLARLLAIGHVVDPRRATAPAVTPDEAIPQQIAVGSPEWGQYAWLNNYAVQLQRQGKTDEAVEAFQKAIDANPGRSTPFLNLAIALAKADQFTSAENVFFAGIERGVGNPVEMILDFAAWHRKEGNGVLAINVLMRGRQLFPDSPEIAANLGSALAAEMRYTDGVAELERALSIQPSSTLVLNNLGLIHVRRNDYARALDYWNRSLAIDPAQPKIRAGVEALRTRL
jgi:predicted AlkP superfamily phosphohydrolase/phosphomutase/Tfp pilus assembly protein PilF